MRKLNIAAATKCSRHARNAFAMGEAGSLPGSFTNPTGAGGSIGLAMPLGDRRSNSKSRVFVDGLIVVRAFQCRPQK
jgi:hypothetical protein